MSLIRLHSFQAGAQGPEQVSFYKSLADEVFPMCSSASKSYSIKMRQVNGKPYAFSVAERISKKEKSSIKIN